MAQSQVKAGAIKDFVNLMIGALDAGFVEGSTLTLAQVHEIARNHIEDTHGIKTKTLREEWGDEVAELCGAPKSK